MTPVQPIPAELRATGDASRMPPPNRDGNRGHWAATKEKLNPPLSMQPPAVPSLGLTWVYGTDPSLTAHPGGVASGLSAVSGATGLPTPQASLQKVKLAQ